MFAGSFVVSFIQPFKILKKTGVRNIIFYYLCAVVVHMVLFCSVLPNDNYMVRELVDETAHHSPHTIKTLLLTSNLTYYSPRVTGM